MATLDALEKMLEASPPSSGPRGQTYFHKLQTFLFSKLWSKIITEHMKKHAILLLIFFMWQTEMLECVCVWGGGGYPFESNRPLQGSSREPSWKCSRKS